MPIFSPVQSHINSKFAILAFLYYRYVFGNRVQNTFYDKKNWVEGDNFLIWLNISGKSVIIYVF